MEATCCSLSWRPGSIAACADGPLLQRTPGDTPRICFGDESPPGAYTCSSQASNLNPVCAKVDADPEGRSIRGCCTVGGFGEGSHARAAAGSPKASQVHLSSSLLLHHSTYDVVLCPCRHGRHWKPGGNASRRQALLRRTWLEGIRRWNRQETKDGLCDLHEFAVQSGCGKRGHNKAQALYEQNLERGAIHTWHEWLHRGYRRSLIHHPSCIMHQSCCYSVSCGRRDSLPAMEMYNKGWGMRCWHIRCSNRHCDLNSD